MLGCALYHSSPRVSGLVPSPGDTILVTGRPMSQRFTSPAAASQRLPNEPGTASTSALTSKTIGGSSRRQRRSPLHFPTSTTSTLLPTNDIFIPGHSLSLIVKRLPNAGEFTKTLPLTHPYTQGFTKTLPLTHPYTQGFTKTLPLTHPYTQEFTKTLPLTHPYTQGYTKILPLTHPYTQGFTKTLPLTHPYTQGFTKTLPLTHPYTQGFTKTLPLTHPYTQGFTKILPLTHPYTQGFTKTLPLTHPYAQGYTQIQDHEGPNQSVRPHTHDSP
ncbi:splicing factor 3A subunit 2-like [Eriocheir sinensis]|uniref:splicing factor 3A subunit 2-like n=1 Tax=Eriocheir sinensis TaxID=95602 RepID=UPI0021C896BB|nr:splicing factor 3A subunit 2-like [Eriocheir sinensis]